MKLNSVTYGYSDNGNKYKKSNIGKKAGTIAGAILTQAAYTQKVVDGKSFYTFMNDTIKTLPNKKDKILAYGATAAGVALGTALWAGIGRLLGSGIDAITNKINAAKADKVAEKQ